MNTQEMLAIEQVLMHWASKGKGKALLMHVDNRAVAYGIANWEICGASMQLFRRRWLLRSEYNLEVEALWVPTKENALANPLSPSEYNWIADLARELLH